MDRVAVNGAVLDDADECLVVSPREPDQSAAGVLPDSVSDRVACRIEDAELAEGGLCIELDDLGVVADESDGTAKWRAGDLVAA